MKTSVLFLHLVLFALHGFSQNTIRDIPIEGLQITLPFLDTISNQPHAAELKLDNADWTLFGFDELEEYALDFKYSIYGKSTINGFHVILVKRVYEEEDIHWACLYDADYNMLGALQTAYDNSEGFLSIRSKIDNEGITVSEWNTYNDPEDSEKKYKISSRGFEQE